MKAEKIKKIIISEGVKQASLIIEEEIHERCSVRNAVIIFIFCIALLSGIFLMYFIQK